MKKLILLVTVLAGLCTLPLFAAEITNYQNFELDTLLHGIDKPGAPVVTDDYIIFTALRPQDGNGRPRYGRLRPDLRRIR